MFRSNSGVIFISSEAQIAPKRQSLRPQNAVEEQLFERVVLCAWRLRRVSRVEVVQSRFAKTNPIFVGIVERFGFVF
jgi:hypothetical protein